METPDVTPVQARAVVLWVLSFLSLVGVSASTDTSNKIVGLAMGFVTALPVILVYADALIRRARAENLTAIIASRQPENLPLAEVYIPDPEGINGSSGKV